MASLRDIRRRIGSVKNTRKITRAMKLVAGAKMRKAEQVCTRCPTISRYIAFGSRSSDCSLRTLSNILYLQSLKISKMFFWLFIPLTAGFVAPLTLRLQSLPYNRRRTTKAKVSL